MIGCEIEACNLTASEVQNADQLALVSDAWTKPTDGVGVEVGWNGGLFPGSATIFL